MTGPSSASAYFLHDIPISFQLWKLLCLGEISQVMSERRLPTIIFYRQLALSLNSLHAPGAPTVSAAHLNFFAIQQTAFRYLIDILAEEEVPGILEQALRQSGYALDSQDVVQAMVRFVELFPPAEVLTDEVSATKWLNMPNQGVNRRHMVLREMLLLHVAVENPAVENFRDILDDRDLILTSDYRTITSRIQTALNDGPFLQLLGCSLGEALLAPVMAAPGYLADQIRFMRDRWQPLLPSDLFEELSTAFDFLLEEERERGWGEEPGPTPVLEFTTGGRPAREMAAGHHGDSVFAGFDYPEYEHFSADADWMSNVVLMAKMVYVWLDQLSCSYRFPIRRLDQVPDAELDRMAGWGFTGLWLIGLWERSPASQRIKQICGNHDAIASAYSLYDYEVADDLGGWVALTNLRERAGKRGIRLASDMVPNHTGIYSRWVIQHPDWFVQTDYPPFPAYQFNGENLSHDDNVCIQLEDGYWSKHDAAVVFRLYDRRDGRTRYIYHGNDGTSIPWNDTAQLNYLIPELREAVIQTILHVARNFQIIRFDAAMTLAKKHYQRLWFPLRGLGGGIPSRAEHGMGKDEFDAVFPVEFWREVVDRVAVEAPGTLLLAEAFWMMEGYFVRTLGMHRVYNSAFMNMLKAEENAKYRTTIKNVLGFNHEILKRFVNFMNNPDEKTAVAQFGSQGKYFGACVLLVTMPGLPMFGHGQIEGFHEKYGMEYKKSYWDEQVDEGLMRGHEMWIFPLLRRRWLFSGSENFVLYDFLAGDVVDENVFAYSNRAGDSRALVLYNNSHSATSGRIRDSVGFNVKSGDVEPEICRTTLGLALGCGTLEGEYYAFRDHAQGLEYLRNGREIHDKGLYVEFGEYQFYLFQNFREIHDDAEGNWSRLCLALNGRGAENLDDELKLMRYSALNKAFLAVLESATGVVAERPFANFAKVTGELLEFTAELDRLTVDECGIGSRDIRLSTIAAGLNRISSLLRMKTVSLGAAAFQTRVKRVLSSDANCRLLFAWFLLRDKQPDVFERFGLDVALGRLLDRNGSRHSIQILSALFGLGETVVMPAHIFAVSACHDFLQVHENGSVEWFNKERFEELSEWLAIMGFLVPYKLSPATGAFSVTAAKSESLLKRYNTMAAKAGYRTGLFIQSLEASKKSTAAKKGAPRAVKKSKIEPETNKSEQPRIH